MKAVRTGKDVKGPDGEYVRAFMVANEFGEEECHHTRAGIVWGAIQMRVKRNGSGQKKRTTYTGCSNGFADFNSFAVWCNSQIGYMNRESNGKFWCLDKDIIKPFNKIYSEETCCFVPNELNCLLTYSSGTRGEHPLGVHFDKRHEVYVAQGSHNNTRKFLGYFKTSEEAHSAYQKFKVFKIAAMIEKYSGLVDDKVILGLNLHKQLFQTDIENRVETIR